MTTTCARCGGTWSGLRAEHCDTCHQTFNSTAPGDQHRVGDHHDRSRRCLTVAEMEDRGMARNARGLWVTSLRDYANE